MSYQVVIGAGILSVVFGLLRGRTSRLDVASRCHPEAVVGDETVDNALTSAPGRVQRRSGQPTSEAHRHCTPRSGASVDLSTRHRRPRVCEVLRQPATVAPKVFDSTTALIASTMAPH
jgi:hypothetical protein